MEEPQKKVTKKLTLVVDKTRFICNALLFNQHPNTLLGKMFSPAMLSRQSGTVTVAPNDCGEYVLSESVSRIGFDSCRISKKNYLQMSILFEVQFLKRCSTITPPVFSAAHWASRFRSFGSY